MNYSTNQISLAKLFSILEVYTVKNKKGFSDADPFT